MVDYVNFYANDDKSWFSKIIKFHWFYNIFQLFAVFKIRSISDPILVPTWLHFWRILGVLGASERLLGRLGASWGRLGAVLERLGGILGRLGASWGRLGAVLGSNPPPQHKPVVSKEREAR